MGRALNTEHPLELLLLVGWMIEVLLPHEFSYQVSLSKERVDPKPLIGDAAAIPGPECTAALTLAAEMAVGDVNVQQRCREAVAARPDAVPRWS